LGFETRILRFETKKMEQQRQVEVIYPKTLKEGVLHDLEGHGFFTTGKK